MRAPELRTDLAVQACAISQIAGSLSRDVSEIAAHMVYEGGQARALEAVARRFAMSRVADLRAELDRLDALLASPSNVVAFPGATGGDAA